MAGEAEMDTFSLLSHKMVAIIILWGKELKFK